MLRRLAYVAVGATACFAGITVILRYFSDILPLASTEPQSVWRFEAAFPAHCGAMDRTGRGGYHGHFDRRISDEVRGEDSYMIATVAAFTFVDFC